MAKENKKETPAQMLARLQAELKAAQEAVIAEENANREKVDAAFAKLPDCLEKLGIDIAEGEKPFAVFARMVATYHKNGTVYPARKSLIDGERKPVVRLSDEDWAKVDAELQAKPVNVGIIEHCKALAAKFGPTHQTIYLRAKDLGLTTARPVAAK